MTLMKLMALAFISAISVSAFADRVETGIEFAGWQIKTSENIYAGARHTSYPIQNLFDRKPETAWVYSGIDYPKPVMKEGLHYPGDYVIDIHPNQPTWMDELRIMNGYNKSSGSFRENSRAVEIQIFDEEWPVISYGDDQTPKYKVPLRTIKLSDTTGMKSIELPKRKYAHLKIRISKIKRGPTDDLCLSEIQIRAGGEDLIPFPKVFESTQGDECGCGGNFRLETYDGKVIGETAVENWMDLGFNRTNQLYAGIDSHKVWVADVKSEKKIRMLRVPKQLIVGFKWLGPRTAKIECSRAVPEKDFVRFDVLKTVVWHF